MVNQAGVVLKGSKAPGFDGNDKSEAGPCELVAALQSYGSVPRLIELSLHKAYGRVYL